MFASEAGVHDRTATLRNPRRRQRTSSSDSLAISAKRRKQTALTDETFVDPDEARRNRQHASANGSAPKPGHKSSNVGTTKGTTTRRRSSASIDATSSSGNLAVRGKGGRREKRAGAGLTGRGEEGVELTKTNTYTLTRDRSLPMALQEIISNRPWHAKLVPELGYAVAFTADRAIVWRYGHTRAISTHDSGVYVIRLSDESAIAGVAGGHDAFDNLPVGTLVHDAGAGDLALLAVMPGGKVQYFESVRVASETEVARIQSKIQSGAPLRGAVSGVYSGESITHITEAEPDGFVLATNSGRLVHLSVRDPQGRPHVTTQYLKAPENGSQGIFGSIRNVLRFSGSSQDIISINTIPGRERSHRNVLVTRAKGTVQYWTIARHGPKTIEQEWDLKANVAEACRTLSPGITQHELPTFLDLTLTPTKQDANSEIKAMALASFSSSASSQLFLVGLILKEGETFVDLVHPIRSYNGSETAPGRVGKKTQPRLLVPQPGHTAFIVLNTKIIVVSLTRLDDSPDSQLHIEAHEVADNYEECLFFNRKNAFHVVGSAIDIPDERSGKSACDIVVHGFGHVRLAANTAAADEMRSERRQEAIKSRLEQVVFFGAMHDNLLDFRTQDIWRDVTSEEIEQATLAITNQILDSTSPFIPSLSPSVDLHLKHRLQAMQELNRFVRQWKISTESRWTLLWSAEKLYAARATFAVYNERLENREPKQQMLLEEVCEMVPTNEHDEVNPESVRRYLTSHVADFGAIVYWSQRAIDELFEDGVTEVDQQAPLVDQAADIMITALEAAIKFREENAESFGLGKDMVVEHVYQGSYAEMPSVPWTCSELMLQRVGMMTQLLCQMTVKLDQLHGQPEEIGPHQDLITKLAKDAPRLLDVFYLAHEESCRWYKSHYDPEEADAQVVKYHSARTATLLTLCDIGLQLPAVELAEKYNDMYALSLITNRVQQQGNVMIRDPSPEERESGRTLLEEVNRKEDGYFAKYGDNWADAFYPTQISQNDAARMLVRFPHRQRFLSEYLRKAKKQDASLTKFSWIHEVRAEQRFDTAAEDLMTAQRAEVRLWAKQVQLSLAKLNMLAAVETKQVDMKDATKDIKKADQRIALAKKQQDFYDCIRPALMGAIDDAAELDLVMQAFGTYVATRPTLTTIFHDAMEKLVGRQTLEIEPLIDALSLFSPDPRNSNSVSTTNRRFADRRFYTALWLSHTSGLERMDAARAHLTEKCIWRRAILADDWVELSRTEGKSDATVLTEFRSTSVYKTLFRGYEDGFFDAHPPLHPRDLHPAGETVAELKKSTRYASLTEAYLTALAQDLAAEDAALDEVVGKGRLEARWEGLLDVVKADLRGEQDAKGRLMAWMEGERQEMERLLKDKKEEMLVVDEQHPVEVEVKEETIVQNGHAIGGYEDEEHSVRANGHSNTKENGSAGPKTTPKKAKKKAGAKKTKTSKKEEPVEKENKDTEGDVVMLA